MVISTVFLVLITELLFSLTCILLLQESIERTVLKYINQQKEVQGTKYRKALLL